MQYIGSVLASLPTLRAFSFLTHVCYVLLPSGADDLVHRGMLSNPRDLCGLQKSTERRQRVLWSSLRRPLSFDNGLLTAQRGMRGVINAAGRLVQRGVLPSLRRLSIGGAGLEDREQVLRPDAAPHVEAELLPSGRRPPGQLFWVTNDVLPDLHVALGVRADYDWERHGEVVAYMYNSEDDDDTENGDDTEDTEDTGDSFEVEVV